MNPPRYNPVSHQSLGAGSPQQQSLIEEASGSRTSNTPNYHHQAHFLLNQKNRSSPTKLQRQQDHWGQQQQFNKQNRSQTFCQKAVQVNFDYPVDMNGKPLIYPPTATSLHHYLVNSQAGKEILSHTSPHRQRRLNLQRGLSAPAAAPSLSSAGIMANGSIGNLNQAAEPLLDVSVTLNSTQQHFENRLLDQNSHAESAEYPLASPEGVMVGRISTPVPLGSLLPVQVSQEKKMNHSHLIPDIPMNHVSHHHQSSYPVYDM